MEIKILFDNKVKDKKFASGWGFSCLIDGRILFDSGEDFAKLKTNMDIMGVNIEDIEMVILSHEHWDHTGGLFGLIKEKKGLGVYICPSFSKEFKEKILSTGGFFLEGGFREILPGFFLTGEMRAIYKNKPLFEQALIIKREKGLLVITGCSHPGIVEMIREIKNKFPDQKIEFVMGGFHLKDKNIQDLESIIEEIYSLGVEKIAPTHCSGSLAEELFRKKYKNNFVAVSTGVILDI